MRARSVRVRALRLRVVAAVLRAAWPAQVRGRRLKHALRVLLHLTDECLPIVHVVGGLAIHRAGASQAVGSVGVRARHAPRCATHQAVLAVPSVGARAVRQGVAAILACGRN